MPTFVRRLDFEIIWFNFVSEVSHIPVCPLLRHKCVKPLLWKEESTQHHVSTVWEEEKILQSMLTFFLYPELPTTACLEKAFLTVCMCSVEDSVYNSMGFVGHPLNCFLNESAAVVWQFCTWSDLATFPGFVLVGLIEEIPVSYRCF